MRLAESRLTIKQQLPALRTIIVAAVLLPADSTLELLHTLHQSMYRWNASTTYLAEDSRHHTSRAIQEPKHFAVSIALHCIVEDTSNHIVATRSLPSAQHNCK